MTEPAPPATLRVADAPLVVAPDGSDVRVLLRLADGSMAHFELAPGRVSRAVEHRTVSEIWYVVAGRGEMWRGAWRGRVDRGPRARRVPHDPGRQPVPVPRARGAAARRRRRHDAALARRRRGDPRGRLRARLGWPIRPDRSAMYDGSVDTSGDRGCRRGAVERSRLRDPTVSTAGAGRPPIGRSSAAGSCSARRAGQTCRPRRSPRGCGRRVPRRRTDPERTLDRPEARRPRSRPYAGSRRMRSPSAVSGRVDGAPASSMTPCAPRTSGTRPVHGRQRAAQREDRSRAVGIGPADEDRVDRRSA